MKPEETNRAALNRRRFLGNTALVTAGLLMANGTSWASVFATAASDQKYKVAVVDLFILKRQKLGALQLTKDIGADGVEVDMGGLGNRPTFDSQLATPEIRQQFMDKARELGIEICSLSMSGFYAQSFAERDGIDKTIQDCLDTAKAMNVKVVYLPLGGSDLLGTKKTTDVPGVETPPKKDLKVLRAAVIDRLRAIAPKAKEAGVVIGIESPYDAATEAKMLDEIGSDYVKSYFNFANACDNGRDVSTELMALGKKRIAMIHCSDTDGVWLQNDPKVDMKKVKQTLDKMKWGGWLVIERSRDKNDTKNVKGNFGANTTYVKSVFQS